MEEVRVRMFAAVREAAGQDEVSVPPAPLADLLDSLRARYGPSFGRVLDCCTVLVDGQAQARGSRVPVPGGADVALLPPVSGG